MRAAVTIAAILFIGSLGSASDFKKAKLKLAGKQLQIEVADTDELRQKGLMFRQSIPADYGMLFIFDEERVRTFWMKNTFVPLSIGFFDKDKKLVEFFDMQPVKSEMEESVPSYPSQHPAKYALEVRQGWFKKNKISKGTRFQLLDR